MARTNTIEELDLLAGIERQIGELDIRRIKLIGDAQRRGASWEDIGAALGITRQSAWRTYHDRVLRLLDQTSAAVDTDEATLLQSASESLKRVRARRRAP